MLERRECGRDICEPEVRAAHVSPVIALGLLRGGHSCVVASTSPICRRHGLAVDCDQRRTQRRRREEPTLPQARRLPRPRRGRRGRRPLCRHREGRSRRARERLALLQEVAAAGEVRAVDGEQERVHLGERDGDQLALGGKVGQTKRLGDEVRTSDEHCAREDSGKGEGHRSG